MVVALCYLRILLPPDMGERDRYDYPVGISAKCGIREKGRISEACKPRVTPFASFPAIFSIENVWWLAELLVKQ